MSVLNGRSFNVRLHIGEDGVVSLGWVHGMYEVSDMITDIKSIPKEEQAELAKLLGVGHSTDAHVARLLREQTPVEDLMRAFAMEEETVLREVA